MGDERLSLSAEEVDQLARYQAARQARGLPPLIQPSGADLIAAERRRQVTEEGWTPEHDDGHVHGELARAAAVYVLDHALPDDPWWAEQFWPWDLSSYRPIHDDPTRMLVKAGALIAAEIDRLQRAAAPAEEERDG